MKLSTTTTSERGKEQIKTGNEYIMITFTNERRQKFDITFTGEKLKIMSYYNATEKIIDYMDDFQDKPNVNVHRLQ